MTDANPLHVTDLQFPGGKTPATDLERSIAKAISQGHLSLPKLIDLVLDLDEEKGPSGGPG